MTKTAVKLKRKNKTKDGIPKPSTYFKIIKESFKVVGKEYCAKSPISALKQLVDDEQPHIVRIIWIIALIGALLLSGSLVRLTFNKLFASPLITTQDPDGIAASKMIFPAVSICSTNRISKMKVTGLAKKLLSLPHNKNYDEKQMLALLRYLGQFYEHQPQAYPITGNLTALHKALGKYDVNDLLKKLTPACEEIILKCSWKGEPTSCSNLFESRLTMNGYCCAFNYLRDKSDTFDEFDLDPGVNKLGNKTGYSEENGLKLLVRTRNDDDFYYNMPIRGAQLQFTGSHDFPDATSGSYSTQFISSGVYLRILARTSHTRASRDIQNIPVKVRKCMFFDESPYLKYYTYSDCMLKCRMLFLKDMCNCTPFNIPKMAKVKTCDLTDLECLRKYHDQSITTHTKIDIVEDIISNDPDGRIECHMCYPACSKTSYNFEFTKIKINLEGFNSVPNSQRAKWLVNADYNFTSIVNIRHGNMFGYLYGQSIIMKWFDLFSNIGSTCGFVTGLSFVSVLEIMYYFTIKVGGEIKARKSATYPSKIEQVKVKVSSKSKEKLPDLYWGEVTGSIRPKLHTKI